jgi:hypothetical protein
VLPAIADTNGCFESDPRKICQLTCSKIADLEQLFRILQNEGMIESYEVQGKQYWYLSQFLDVQRLRTKAQTPNPPWIGWKPEKGAENQGHTSQGRYFDRRKQPELLPPPIDKKFTPDVEEKRCDIDIEEDKELKICASAEKEERMTLALHQLLDGQTGIRATLNGSESQQRETIQRMMQLTSRSLGIQDIVKEYEIVCDEGNWKVKKKI